MSTAFFKVKGLVFENPVNAPILDYKELINALPNLLSWVNASDTTVVKDGSNRVSELIDKATGGAGWAQNTAANQPLQVADGLGSQPVLRFDSARKDFFSFQGAFPTGATAKHTKVLLFKPVNPGSTANLLSDNTGSSGKHSLYLTPGLSLNAQVTQNLDLGNITEDWHVVITSHDADNDLLSGSVNNAAELSVSSTDEVTNAGAYLGAANSSGGAPTTFDLAETLIFDGLVDQSGRDLIFDYITKKYGLIF